MTRSVTRPVTRSGRAVVIGGSIAGILAAQTLREHVDQVVVLDRDDMPEPPRAARRRTPGAPRTRAPGPWPPGRRGAVPRRDGRPREARGAARRRRS